MKYPFSELVLDDKNRVYHLGLHPENIAHKIIVVGDQDRVDLIAKQFNSIKHTSQHREFKCITGTYGNKLISAISTGIGTDNIDIVVNELDALVNIDLDQREDKPTTTSLDIVRIGTCGILQPEIPVHSYVLSTHAFGLDNVAHFYQVPFTSEEHNLGNSLMNHLGLPKEIVPYMIAANAELTERLSGEQVFSGITVTSSGFYGPQGRQLRLANRAEKLNEKLSEFKSGNFRVTNFEMESSALFALGRSLGHRCSTICLGVANRPNMEFSKGYGAEMEKLITYVLDRI